MEEARAWINRFLTTYPGVARWQREQEMRTRETSSVSTRGGRVHRFAWEPSGEYSRNLALNLPIQGTAAEIAIEALLRIDARLRAELPGMAQLVLKCTMSSLLRSKALKPWCWRQSAYWSRRWLPHSRRYFRVRQRKAWSLPILDRRGRRPKAINARKMPLGLPAGLCSGVTLVPAPPTPYIRSKALFKDEGH